MKLDPKVYRKAASYIDAGSQSYACIALERATRRLDGPYSTEFRELFHPDHDTCIIWFGPAIEKENQNARVIALLLMAEIVEDVNESN
jgi:hypothetical protein